MSRILTREQYLDTLRTQRYSKFTGIPKTNEAFSNDVNWGDSWVGRLINSISRKVKIRFGLKRIDGLTGRLKALFDEMLESSKIECPEGVDKFIVTSYLLGELEDALKNDEDVPKIIDILINLEQQIDSYALEDKDELKRKIVEFRQYLEGLEIKDFEVGVEGDKDKQESDIGKLTYGIMIMNLQDLKSVLDNLKNVSLEDEKKEVGKNYLLPDGGKDKLVKLVSLTHVKKVGPDKRFITDDDLEVNQLKPGEGFVVFLDDQRDYNETSPTKSVSLKLLKPSLNESFDLMMEEVVPGVRPGASSTVTKKETTSTTAFNKIKTATIQLIDSKVKGIAIDSKFLADVLSKKNDEATKDVIKDLYKLIYSYLLGERRNTLNPDKTTLFENLETLKDKSKIGIVAEKISRFSYISLKFNDKDNPLALNPKKTEGLYSTMGDFGKALEKYNKSLSDILNSMKGSSSYTPEKVEYKVGDVVKYKLKSGGEGEKEITKIEGDKFFFKSKSGEELYSSIKNIISKVDKNKEEKKESNLLRYNGFRKIYEKSGGINYEEIAAKFNEIFDEETLKKFQFDEGEVEEIKKIGSESDRIILRNSDPIIEIVRLFQRAWRLHTPGPIPSGRSEGKVSMSVFLEYEYVGSGEGGTPDRPGSGPYRNIELFDKWDSAVWDILNDTKYRTTIFSDDAKFAWAYGISGTEEERVKTAQISKETLKGTFGRNENYKFDKRFKLNESEGDEKMVEKPLGKILLRFITELNNDPTMYRGGRDGGGKLQKFLNEYFGLSDAAIKAAGGLTSPGFREDGKKNRENLAGVEKPTNVKFIKSNECVNTKVGVFKYFKDVAETSGEVFKLEINDKDMYLYCLSYLPNGKSYFVLMDGFETDSKTVVNQRRTVSTDVFLLVIDRLSETNFSIKKGGKIIANSVYKNLKQSSNERENDKTFEIKEEPKVLVYSGGDDKGKIYLKAKFLTLKQGDAIRGSINSIKQGLIK